jgi:hypothetical protein
VGTSITSSQDVRHRRGWCSPILQGPLALGLRKQGYATRFGKARMMAAVRFETSSLA